jgi:hypothetical protein
MVTTMRTVRVSWLLLLALALGAVVARPAAADDRSVDVGVENFQHTCHDGGGTLDESHYEFNTDGSVRFATVRCKGGDYDGWSCDIFPGPTPTQCSRVFDPGTGGLERHRQRRRQCRRAAHGARPDGRPDGRLLGRRNGRRVRGGRRSRGLRDPRARGHA